MAQRDLLLKNAQAYNEDGDPLQGLMEGKAVQKFTYLEVPRLQKGTRKVIDETYIEVTLTMSSIDADLKYFALEQLVRGKTPIIPFIICEAVDKETGNVERLRISEISLDPEELTLWEAKAEGNDRATYVITGRSNLEPDFLEKLPEYDE
ncbi:hypothetical protein [Brevibacillus choshinensis]|uniref:Uncharacterized protein n=1 Tax=Brevibacillus choshinensis TaxID=54911 RepID=A0ABX7FHR7_BRECH|nr:hypothetical protein [Brevibacillus choshinensis]QRG65247.1 hypothetical protein JNE38_16520 [Brevibacillus choshinensis]